jgi:hypothetical protein
MSKEKQLYEILRTLQKGEIGTDLAHLQILRLFSVVGRSEQLVCDHPKIEDIDNFSDRMKCTTCGKSF